MCVPAPTLRLPSLFFVLSTALACCVGCDVPIASFEPNVLYRKRMELSEDVKLDKAQEDIQAALDELFGTPDNPKWPEFLADDEEFADLVALDRLQRAAGPVRSDEQGVHFGLFREHCVHCHGVTGNGRGPTSQFLNPYPRDFRMGKVKFKSTTIGQKPTRSDLLRILREGVMGTSMPSFRLLDDEDIDALVDYVIFLSVRGEVERRLIAEAAFELDYEYGDRLWNPGLKESSDEEDAEELAAQWEVIQDYVVEVADSWIQAAGDVPEIAGAAEDYPLFGRDNAASPEQQARLAASVANGRRLFQGKVANCASCHGATAMGDGQANDYDEWTKEWTTAMGLDPKDREDIAPMLELGALKPRNILPRNLRIGVYRGGSRPIDLYLRIAQGIDGTPMPAAAMKPANPQGMTEEEVWDIVNYVLSLPYEHISQQGDNVPPFQRERL
ncbi:MAG: cytochrome c [Planctomycetales bacterium]|nr:cytochrome c [Planctomycetales bacterium]